MRGLAALVAIATICTGCATVLGSKSHDFNFNSTPDGAEVLVDGNPVGVTPMTVNLSNTQAHSVVFKKKGYADIGCQLGKGTGAGWVIADVVFGVVPLVVDAATNNWSQTKTHECNQNLQAVTASAQ
ncbi:MAG: PEGA domain-containing protein [Terracidiphilus sp.]